ncbi:hypothetical protein C0068_10630 [Zhongshania marina]|uniref:Uncharacterized protein n=1 Tax=Zhongshania marina TaxID=2304603 RepID=A0A2S4HF82_9GAMM|nr:hypothetical protein C0068_10630 [Marortus luteolus]
MNYARSLFAAIAVGARSYARWYGDFVGGRWPRPPSLAIKPQFTLPGAERITRKTSFAAIAVSQGELRSKRGQPGLARSLGLVGFVGGRAFLSCRRPLAQATFSCDKAAIHLGRGRKNYARTSFKAIAVGARSYARWYGDFVGGRWLIVCRRPR